jgi:hypothetical protein
MIEVKEAIRIAMERVRELFGESGSGARGVQDLRLEEVEANDQGDWLITVSFLPALAGTAASAGGDFVTKSWPQTIIGVDPRRSYKEVAVSNDGQVKAIRVRPIVVR